MNEIVSGLCRIDACEGLLESYATFRGDGAALVHGARDASTPGRARQRVQAPHGAAMSLSGRSASLADSPRRGGNAPGSPQQGSRSYGRYGGGDEFATPEASVSGGGPGGGPSGPESGAEPGMWLPSELRSHVMRVVVNAGCVTSFLATRALRFF